MSENEHPSLNPVKIEETVEPIELPSVDLSKVKAQATRITESLNLLITQTETELDSIEQRVLELVASNLEKRKGHASSNP